MSTHFSRVKLSSAQLGTVLFGWMNDTLISFILFSIVVAVVVPYGRCSLIQPVPVSACVLDSINVMVKKGRFEIGER